MKIPLELSFRGVGKTPEIEALIQDKVKKLQQFCDYLTSCRVAVESPQEHQRAGNPFRVRIDVRVPPGHEIVVTRESSEGHLHDTLPVVLRDAFDAAGRQLRKLTEQQRGDVKRHPAQETMGFVTKLFSKKGYGFLRSQDGREICFHSNSVMQDDLQRLEIGTGVRFVEAQGEEGPQASTVQIVHKPGARVNKGCPESEAYTCPMNE